MGKITVKHYLNKSVKPRIEGNNELYPLYVQVIANRTNYRFKSNCSLNDGYFTESTLMQDYMISINNSEKRKIEKIVSYIQESNKLDLMTAETINKYSANLWDVLNRNFGTLFEKESEVLQNSFPDVLAHRSFFDINEILNFTESEIELKFSENYRNCKIAMNAIENALFSEILKDLHINNLTVFDFLHSEGSDKVMKAIKSYYGIYGGDENKEYLQILNEISKLLSLQ